MLRQFAFGSVWCCLGSTRFLCFPGSYCYTVIHIWYSTFLCHCPCSQSKNIENLKFCRILHWKPHIVMYSEVAWGYLVKDRKNGNNSVKSFKFSFGTISPRGGGKSTNWHRETLLPNDDFALLFALFIRAEWSLLHVANLLSNTVLSLSP